MIFRIYIYKGKIFKRNTANLVNILISNFFIQLVLIFVFDCLLLHFLQIYILTVIFLNNTVPELRKCSEAQHSGQIADFASTRAQSSISRTQLKLPGMEVPFCNPEELGKSQAMQRIKMAGGSQANGLVSKEGDSLH